MERMKAALVYGPSEIRVIDVPKPDVRDGDVLARVNICMTSGTTVKQYARPYPGLDYPYGIGYEWAGEIVQVGAGVGSDLVGKRCISSWKRKPDDCFFCLRGQPNLCANIERKGYGSTWSDKPEQGIVSGMFKEYAAMPVSAVDVLPEEMSIRDGAQIHYLTYVQHGNSLLDIEIGDTVAVVGSGVVGILHMMLSHLRGAQTIAIDPNRKRLDFAKSIGAADHVIEADDTQSAKEGLRQLDISSEYGPDIVIESVGIPQTYEESINLVRRGGQVLLFAGAAPDTSITVSTYKLHYEEIRVIGSMHASLIDYKRAFSIVKKGLIEPSLFLSGDYPLAEVKNALDAHRDGRGMKFAVIP